MAIFYVDSQDGDVGNSGKGWWAIAFTSGGTYEPQVDDQIDGATSGASAIISSIEVDTGSWAGGDAAGTLYLYGKTGTFQSENLDIGVNTNIATISGDASYDAKEKINQISAAWTAPDDFIYLRKSPAPTSLGQSVQWTNDSALLTLTTAVTKNIDMCDAVWTASANVTAEATTSTIYRFREGTACARLIIASGFTTGKVAYKALGATEDFSSYQQISLWIKGSTAPGIVAGQFSLKLCSDTTGDTAVDSIDFPSTGDDDCWMPICIDTGGALGSSIQSVALYADSDPGTTDIFLDCIIACKDPDDDDALSLCSLISKNSAEQGGDEGWYTIGYINGTSIKFGTPYNVQHANAPVYPGTTESVTTYKRETLKTAPTALTTTVFQEDSEGGSTGHPISFYGGINPADNTQDGETFQDGQTGNGRGILLGDTDIVVDRLNFVRYNTGYQTSGYYNCVVKNVQTIMQCEVGINSSEITWLSIKNVIGCNTDNIILSGHSVIFELGRSVGSITGEGVRFVSNVAGELTMYDAGQIAYNGGYGITLSGRGNIFNAHLHDNSTGGVYITVGIVAKLWNCLLEDSTELVVVNVESNTHGMWSVRHDQTANNNYFENNFGYIQSQTSVRHTASGIAWEIYPGDERYDVYSPQRLSVVQIACAASKLVTVKCWFRRTHATDIYARLILYANTVPGVTADAVENMSAIADTWEELEITFTPNEACVAEIWAEAYYGPATVTDTRSVYVDDVTVTQAA